MGNGNRLGQDIDIGSKRKSCFLFFGLEGKYSRKLETNLKKTVDEIASVETLIRYI